MIVLPPDGRQDAGGRIEAMAWGLEEVVTSYLNMLSLADRPKGEEKVRATFRSFPVLAKLLSL